MVSKKKKSFSAARQQITRPDRRDVTKLELLPC